MQAAPSTPDLSSLKIAELQTRWRCSRPTVSKMLRLGKAKIIRVGTNVIVPLHEVERIENSATEVYSDDECLS